MSSSQISDNSSARHKLAYILGNDAYSEYPLHNCVQDADDISNELNSVKFEVTQKSNLMNDEMYSTIESFISLIKSDDFVIFYFAGHGHQWGNQNYLIPCDNEKINNGNDMQRYAINAQLILDRMAARQPFVVVLLLDCCRSYWEPKEERRRSNITIGLHDMQAPSETIIAFACAAGREASDRSSNGRNGVFTKHLLQHITSPGLDIEQMLRRVAAGVAKETSNTQRSYRHSSIMKEYVCIVPNPSAREEIKPSSSTANSPTRNEQDAAVGE